MDVNFCYGQNPVTVREKYREAHDLILKAWQEREPFAWNGKYTKLRYVNLWPQPIQKPHPPIYMGAFTPAAMARIAREANGWSPVDGR